MEYKPSCPNCNSINTYNRTTLKPKWKCNRCKYEFNIGVIYKSERYAKGLNFFVLIALIIVSVALVGVTWYSASVSDELGDIEVYLANQKEKQETLEQITVAENLLIETELNELFIKNLLPALEENRDNKYENQSYEIKMKTNRLQQAKDMISFGNTTIRIQMEFSLAILDRLILDLEAVSKANNPFDYDIKIERIESAIEYSYKYINPSVSNFNINEFKANLISYISERTEHYKSIDKETEENLLNLS